MKKVLVGALIACLTLGLATVAFAGTEISTSGAIEFTVSGTSDGASGLFGAGDVLIDYNVVATSGPWKAVVSPEFDIGGDDFCECDAYIDYEGEAFTLRLDPTGISNAVFDIYSYKADDELNMKGNPGIKLTIPMEGFSFYVVANNQDDGEGNTVFNFGGGVDFSMDSLSFGLKFNSDSVETSDFYGTSYGAKVGYSMGALSLTGEYGAWNPKEDTLEAGSGYFFKMVYTLAGGDSLTLQYKSSDENLNGLTSGPTDHAYSQIKGVYSHSLAENVTCSFEVASTDNGYDEESVTTWKAKLSISV